MSFQDAFVPPPDQPDPQITPNNLVQQTSDSSSPWTQDQPDTLINPNRMLNALVRKGVSDDTARQMVRRQQAQQAQKQPKLDLSAYGTPGEDVVDPDPVPSEPRIPRLTSRPARSQSIPPVA
jgi:hypothetical protein